MNHLILVLVVGLFIPSAFPQECTITSELVDNNTIIIGTSGDPIDEDDPGDILWRGTMSSKGGSVTIIVHPPGGNADDLLDYTFPGDNDFIIGAGPEFGNYIDKYQYVGEIYIVIEVRCANGVAVPPIFIKIFIEPKNNKLPTFDPTSMSIDNIKVPWNTDIPLNYEIPLVVTDEDYSIGVLESVTTTGDFRIVWDNTTGDVKLFSTKEIFETTNINIIASDGDSSHDGILPVSITVSGTNNYCPPVFIDTVGLPVSHYLKDEAPTDLKITQFKADDTDKAGVNIRYSTTNPNVTIDPIELTVSFNDTSFLPGPNQLPYYFEITAAEEVPSGQPSKESKVLVLLDYPLDSQDIFKEKFYKIRVPAGLGLGEEVGPIELNGDIKFLDGLDTFFRIQGKQIFLQSRPGEDDDLPNDVHVTSVVPDVVGSSDSTQHATLVFIFEKSDSTTTTTATTITTAPTTTESGGGTTTTGCDCDCTPTTPAECSTTTTPSDGSTTTPSDGSTTTPSDGSTTTPSDGSTTTPSDGSTTTPSDGSTTTTCQCETTPLPITTTPCPFDCSECTSTSTSPTTTSFTTTTTDDSSSSTTTGSGEPTTPCEPCTSTTIGTTECPSTVVTSEPCEFTTTTLATTECPPSTSTECPTTTTSTEFSTTCPICPTTCPTCPTAPTSATECPPSTTSAECPTTCPICPTTCPTSPTSTTECPPSTTSAECPTTCPICPTTCPICPTTCPTAPPCTTECPPTTSSDCPPQNSSTQGPNCPTPEPRTDECEDNNTGWIAGIAVTSVLFVASAGAAGFLYFKLRKSSSIGGSMSSKKPGGGDDFGENSDYVGRGFANPTLNLARKSSLAATSDKLPLVNEYDDISERPAVAVAPTPVSSVGYDNPNLRRSSVVSSNSYGKIGGDGGEKKELKPSLAKPKEIPADYDGAETVQEKVPKKEKKILFVGEEVIPNQDVDHDVGPDVDDERL